MPRLVVFCVVLCATASVQAAPNGAEIYKARCASCHGPKGEGVADQYSQALVGDKSVGELAELIERTMPEGEPEKCVGDDARAVARYIYDEFYSPLAQARLSPARVELSRLTVRQYRETLADLIGTFRPSGSWGDQRGLKGAYYRSRQFGNKAKLFDRVDPLIAFNFGDQNPHPEGDKAEFAVRWQGAVLAPETGDYEFNLRTENGAQLWVNDLRKPLIDNSVRSGSDPNHRETIRLLGGRAYPLAIELYKSARGKDKTASLELRWTPPGRIEELVPTANLSTAVLPEAFVAAVPFPPDDRSRGYERGSDVSKAWDQATTDGALEAAAYIVARLPELAGAAAGAKDRPQKIRAFAEAFVPRAFRRPLSDDERQLYIERQFQEAKTPEQAVQRVVLLTLKSPRFLYRDLDPTSDDASSTAARLAFVLWDSLPDQTLLDAAAAGKLNNPDELRRQAERMSADPRARTKLREFFLQWLLVDHFGELAKDSRKFPDFDKAVAADLRTSFDLFLDDVLKSPEADFRRLLTSDELYLNGRLAKFFTVRMDADAPFTKVNQPGSRAGVLTHPLLLSGLAYTDVGSPIHRGVLISRNILGRALKPPPEAVVPLAADLHPGLTTRERVTLQTKAQACAACHTMINSLGFALENFDAVGRFRETEKSKPIDATGRYRTRDDKTVEFRGAAELAKFLADSPETHAAVVEQMFQYYTKQPILAYGLDRPAELRKAFEDRKLNLRSLAVEIALAASRKVVPPASLTSTPGP